MGKQKGFNESPAHQQFADGCKLGRREALGEDVRLLFEGVDILGNDAFVFTNLGPEEVAFEGEVLVSGGHLGNVDQQEAPLIVLKDGGFNQADGDSR